MSGWVSDDTSPTAFTFEVAAVTSANHLGILNCLCLMQLNTVVNSANLRHLFYANYAWDLGRYVSFEPLTLSSMSLQWFN
jgi:hypothetical protein